MIQDSGTRREFETGAVRDIQEGKGRCDLLPLDMIAEMYKDFDDNNTATVFSYLAEFQKTGSAGFLTDLLWHCKGIFPDLSTMFIELSKHFEEGATKYGERNWQKGIPTHCYVDSAIRHYLKWLRNDGDERHDRAFIWNVLCCAWTVKNKPEMNDYPLGDKDV